MRQLAFTLSESSLPSSALPSLASVIKVILVISLHLGLLAAALQATGMISRGALPVPMELLTVTIKTPEKPHSEATIPPPVMPRLVKVNIPVPEIAQLSMPTPAAINEAPVAATLTPAKTSEAIVQQARAESVTEANFDAAYLNNPAPAYPLMSRRNGEAGRVVLTVHVSKLGTAAQVEIKQSSGFARLDEAALETVRKWRFIPARRGDETIAASVVVPLTFKLNS